jgi:hypothetical protein
MPRRIRRVACPSLDKYLFDDLLKHVLGFLDLALLSTGCKHDKQGIGCLHHPTNTDGFLLQSSVWHLAPPLLLTAKPPVNKMQTPQDANTTNKHTHKHTNKMLTAKSPQ